MEQYKIFDRRDIFETILNDDGLILVKSIFDNEFEVMNLINEFIIGSEIFETILLVASKILNIKKTDLVTYTSRKYIWGWYAHCILIKSILRHIENHMTKLRMTTQIYRNKKRYTIDDIKNCTLTTIVENIKYCDINRTWPIEHDQKFNCKGILNKDDMFNDDLLIFECTKYIIDRTQLFPKCLCYIVCSYLK
jgi:hypothetical protein